MIRDKDVFTCDGEEGGGRGRGRGLFIILYFFAGFPEPIDKQLKLSPIGCNFL